MTSRRSRTRSPRVAGGSSHRDDIDPMLAGWLGQPGLDLVDVDAAVLGSSPGMLVELARRGARVTAVHPARQSSRRARRALPLRWRRRVAWRTADLAAPNADLVGAFGLVIASATVEALPPAERDPAMLGIGSLVGDGGVLVAIVALATSDEARRASTGPPWPLAPAELTAWRAAGLERLELAHPPASSPPPPVQRVRTTWRRPRADDDQVTGPVRG